MIKELQNVNCFDLEHERCRSKICVVCYQKANCTLPDLEIQTVHEFLIDSYNVTDPDFPSGICTGCSIILSKKQKNVDFKIKVLENYDQERKVVLQSVDTCLCRIYRETKMNGLSPLQKSRKKCKQGRPVPNPAPNHLKKICSNCFSIIAKGSNHSASLCKHSKRVKVDKLIQISSPSTLQRAASRDQQNYFITLLGRPKQIEEVKKILFPSPDWAGIQQDLGISNSQTKILLCDIRLASGSHSIIEKNAFVKTQEKNQQLDSFFKLNKLVYRVNEKETNISKNMEFPTIVCSDLPGLIDMVLEKCERQRDSILIKINVDGGGGFLKICASIFETDDPTPRVCGTLSKKFLESGVKKILIVGLVPDVSENYVNVKRLWINCGVEKLRNYTVATDLKVFNILLGMMSYSSCHTCP